MIRIRSYLQSVAMTGLILAAVSCITTGDSAHAGTAQGAPLPSEVYAPYFETWVSDNLSDIAEPSGVKYFTLAFIQATSANSCTPSWDGNPEQLIGESNYANAITTLREQGGDVIISFGGSAADNSGTDIADSCGNVSQLAKAYESVISRYNISRIDLDVEGKSLTNNIGINHRNEALALTESWAIQNGRSLQIQYTLPVTSSGLTENDLKLLTNASADHVKVSIVNAMAFDYLSPNEGTVNMGSAAINALKNMHTQIGKMYPIKTSSDLWRMEGVTLLPGIDSNPAKTEVTYLSDAMNVNSFAQLNHISAISIWAVQRDNGNCPGVGDSSLCSGLAQSDWAFSATLNSYNE